LGQKIQNDLGRDK